MLQLITLFATLVVIFLCLDAMWSYDKFREILGNVFTLLAIECYPNNHRLHMLQLLRAWNRIEKRRKKLYDNDNRLVR